MAEECTRLGPKLGACHIEVKTVIEQIKQGSEGDVIAILWRNDNFQGMLMLAELLSRGANVMFTDGAGASKGGCLHYALISSVSYVKEAHCDVGLLYSVTIRNYSGDPNNDPRRSFSLHPHLFSHPILSVVA